MVLFKSGEVELQEAAELSQEGEKLARRNISPKEAIKHWDKSVTSILTGYFGESSLYAQQFSSPLLSAIELGVSPNSIAEYASHLETRLVKLERIIFSIEERKLSTIRKSTSEYELSKSPKYWLTYNDIQGILYLHNSDGMRVILIRTNLDSTSDSLLQELFNNSDGIINIKESVLPTKMIPSVLRDIKLTHDLKKIFIPRTNGNKIRFRRAITHEEFKDEGYDELNFANYETA
ncbi:MAG TPA: hypothetical protein PKA29_01740 [Candidatus Saccharibacteria bacterium]|nr:hypothetical protein [Candidatus Saccharibacteria bacterium]